LFVLASLELWMRTNIDSVSTKPSSFDEILDDGGRRSTAGSVHAAPDRRPMVTHP
jgi:hypothetical protein